MEVTENSTSVAEILENLKSIYGEILSCPEKSGDEVFLESAKSFINQPLPSEVLPISLRAFILNIFNSHRHESDELFDSVFKILDFIQKCTDGEAPKDPCLVLGMIENILDVVAIPHVERIFEYLENYPGINTPAVYNKGKSLILLRFLNEAQRRLNNTTYNRLSGWLLAFISNVFPLSERSGVNLRGEFNTENKTSIYDFDVQPIINDDYSEEILQLYKSVCALQDCFSNPPKILDNCQFPQFKAHVDKFIGYIESEQNTQSKVQESSLNTNNSSRWSAPMDIDNPSGTSKEIIPSTSSENKSLFESFALNYISDKKEFNYFSPKYFSGIDVFETQIHDVNFIRQMVTQLVYILDYLAQSPNILGEHTAAVNNSNPSEESIKVTDWINGTKRRAFKVLELGNVCDKSFIKSLDQLLESDKLWADWKKNSCRTVSPSGDKFSLLELNKKIKLSVSGCVRNRDLIGTSELSDLWNLTSETDNIMTNSEDKFNPDIYDLLDAFITPNEEEPREDSDARNEPILPTPYLWRCCRAALRNNFSIFCTPTTPQPSTPPKEYNIIKILLDDPLTSAKNKNVSNDPLPKKAAY